MMSDRTNPSKRPLGYPEPFPWHCVACAKKEVYPREIRYEKRFKHEGIIFPLVLERLQIPICDACGEKQFTIDVNDQVIAHFRRVLQLLTPEQIRDGMAQLATTAKELSERFGVAEKSVERWAAGRELQPRAMDDLLRNCFGLPEVRAVSRGTAQDTEYGTPEVLSPSEQTRL